LPIELDGYDVSILKSLFEDGRKSFRQVSRETGITTPTVKARFERMVNVGFIKGVLPVIDYARVKNCTTISELPAYNQNQHIMKIKKGMKIMLDCDLSWNYNW
jgi:DNA-binding Lrp family transcriptional regulator